MNRTAEAWSMRQRDGAVLVLVILGAVVLPFLASWGNERRLPWMLFMWQFGIIWFTGENYFRNRAFHMLPMSRATHSTWAWIETVVAAPAIMAPAALPASLCLSVALREPLLLPNVLLMLLEILAFLGAVSLVRIIWRCSSSQSPWPYGSSRLSGGLSNPKG